MKNLCSTLLCLSLFTASVWAVTPNTQAHHLTLSGNIGIGAGATPLVAKGLSFGAQLAYQLKPRTDVALGFIHLPNAGNSVTYDYYTAAVLAFPVNKTWHLFTKAGPALVHNVQNSQSNTQLALLIGAGTAYTLKQNISITLQATGTLGGRRANTYVILTGLSYRFSHV